MSDPQDLTIAKGLAVAAWILLILTAERAAPAVARRGGWPRILRNAGLFAVNIGLSRLAVIPITVFAASVALDWRPSWLQGGWALVADLLILDLWIYFWHRANHAVPFLWRFHEIHHLDEFLDASSAVRFHAGEVLMSAAVRAVVIVLLDIPLASVLAFETLVLVAAVFQHSNTRLPPALERALSAVIVTPSIHWVHHHAVRRDTDSNYGTGLSVWDRIFATLSPTPRTPEMAIGVERAHDRGFLALLIRPFRSGGEPD
ncbi:sterol desaturase family protein [Thalassobaculum sp. OXR-137]|uniref:sterol desaturase family protein n=1 Tax=Thalassobaculum sp. OXR-137 TaxID=3100173 RepID=UPI002AC995D8|nr:sterol desaturase family protein [Thalassobaculum sp. OXR-137]WPZ35406.1 sterol desaturase family protein [Thalassobaculum sp. OXR-137]